MREIGIYVLVCRIQIYYTFRYNHIIKVTVGKVS